MSLRWKNAAAGLLAAVLTFALAGCTKPVPEPVGPDVPKPVVIEAHAPKLAYRENPVEIGFVDYSLTEGEYRIDGGYVQISGLKNKTVEEKINGAIRSLFNEFVGSKELPAYEGLAEQYARDWEGQLPASVNCGVYSAACAENVLSVCLEKYVVYYDDDSYSYENALQYAVRVPKTFDLATGEELKVTDFFASEEEGLAFLNKAVQDRIAAVDETHSPEDYVLQGGEYSAVPAKGEFPGVTPEQPYTLSFLTGTITLLFDDNDTWVGRANYEPVALEIPALEYAYFDRFNTGADLCEAGDGFWVLVSPSVPDEEYVTVSEWTEAFADDAKSWYSVEIFYPASLPAQWIADCVPDAEMIAARKESAAKFYRGVRDEYPDIELHVSASTSLSSRQNGAYTYLWESSGADTHDGDWNWYDSYDDRRITCFQNGKTEPLSISELFAPGADAEGILRTAIKHQILEDGGNPYSAKVDPYLDELFGSGCEFLVGNSGLQLYYGADAYVTAQDYFPNDDVLWTYGSAAGTIPFSRLDMDAYDDGTIRIRGIEPLAEIPLPDAAMGRLSEEAMDSVRTDDPRNDEAVTMEALQGSWYHKDGTVEVFLTVGEGTATICELSDGLPAPFWCGTGNAAVSTPGEHGWNCPCLAIEEEDGTSIALLAVTGIGDGYFRTENSGTFYRVTK